MTVLADRYELGDVLGEGGMGRVVVAHDRVLRRDVAVKLLTRPPDAASKARFLREARDSARLRHPNAVTVFDTGEHDGQPFIVMELVRGMTLAELVAQDGPLDVEVAIAITAGVLEALAAAHEAGLVHRDVKPANVILPEDGGVKLTDFGIAKAMNEATAGLTAAGTVLGTPSYLAPELVEGGTASPASDLYAVGCMLYLQLAGEPPFTAEAPLAIAYAHLNREARPIEEHRPDVPDGLRHVLVTALAKDPADRYADATAMRADLLGGAPTGSPGGSSREATLPLTVAFTPGAPNLAEVAASPGASGTGSGSASGSDVQSDADPTMAIHEDTSNEARGSRPPWRAFAVGAVLLLAFVALAVLWPFGGADPTDEPETVEETDPSDIDEPEPEDGDPSPAEPETDAPDPDEPTAPDGSDEPDEPEETPAEPSPEPDDTTDDATDPPEDTDPPADEGGQGEPGGGQGPEGDGPPGQED